LMGDETRTPCPEPDCTNQSNIPDPAHEGFRVYDSTIGWSEHLDTPFTYGEWVSLEITLDAAAEEYVYTIDGVEVATAAGGSHYIREIFLNSYNFGEDSYPTLDSDSYAAHWHVGSESEIAWTTEKVYPGDMNDWAFGFDSGTDGSGEMVWGPEPPPIGGGSAFFELGDDATGYVLGTQGHGLPGTPFMDVTSLEYSTYRSAGGAAEAVALQFNVDYDLTDSDTSWQGRLVYEPYYTQTVLDDTWQTWDTLASGANWWSTGTPKVADAAATKHCVIGDPCTWEEVLTYYPDAGIHELPLGAVILKAGSGWAGFEGNADELRIATGDTGTIFDFDPYAGGNCVVDASGGGDFLLLEPALAASACEVIEVRAGEYVEEGEVEIDRDVTIIGDDKATTIFKTDSDTGTSGDSRGWFLVSSGD
ncbi:MAG: hypothetical protein R3324_15390, partial [Halobacteriales archaeon]|nr:hypothetical protein [Halobacteriales archaeon]